MENKQGVFSKTISNLIGKIANLISVKKIIALTLTFVFCYLSVNKVIEAKDFMTVFLMIISFYFGASATKQMIYEQKNK